MHDGKIFCVGFHKTGTSSLGRALGILGYRVTGAVGVRNPNIRDELHSIALPLVPHFDAFQDNPWPLLYKELDREWPNSKFILTTRPQKSWIRSAVKHFGHHDTEMRKFIYGVGHPKGNELVYIERYLRHNAAVVEYFETRPNDLLTLRITEGEGWEALCSFLDARVPDIPFPHLSPGGAQRGVPDRSIRTRLEALLRRYLR